MWTAKSGAKLGRAGGLGVEIVAGQDTLPVARRLLGPLADAVEFHMGSILDAVWAGGPIGLHVDDAAKRADVFYHALRTFGPSWVPGTTHVVLMDYHYYRVMAGARRASLLAQRRFIEAHPETFVPVEDLGRLVPNWGVAEGTESTTAVFAYARPFDFSRLRNPYDSFWGRARGRVEAFFR